MRIPWTVPLLALLAAAGAEGQQTPVRVEFRVDEPLYASLFTDPERESLHRSAAELFASFLRERLPVLDLKAGGAADYRLLVTLDRRGGAAANALQSDRGFYVRVIGPDSTTEPTWFGLFRRASLTGGGFGSTGGLPLDRLFLEKIRLALPDADVDALVRDHLSRVPLTSLGRIWTPPPGSFGWVAALDRQATCLARGTGLRVVVLIPSVFQPEPVTEVYLAEVESDFLAEHVFGGTVPPEFAGLKRGVFARPEPMQQSRLDEVRNNASAVVASVYLADFQHDGGVCDQLPTPAEAEARPGGVP